jgi:hypothetical protein
MIATPCMARQGWPLVGHKWVGAGQRWQVWPGLAEAGQPLADHCCPNAACLMLVQVQESAVQNNLPLLTCQPTASHVSPHVHGRAVGWTDSHRRDAGRAPDCT